MLAITGSESLNSSNKNAAIRFSDSLTLKALRKNVAGDILLKYIIYIYIYSDKRKPGVSFESSARPTIHMQYQVFFSLKI